MDEAVEHFGQAARFFARHHRSDIDLGEDALGAEGFGKERTVAYIVADCLDVRTQLGIGQTIGQQVKAFEDRQAGADQRDELLVEDQELLDIDLLAAAQQAAGGAVRGLME